MLSGAPSFQAHLARLLLCCSSVRLLVCSSARLLVCSSARLLVFAVAATTATASNATKGIPGHWQSQLRTRLLLMLMLRLSSLRYGEDGITTGIAVCFDEYANGNAEHGIQVCAFACANRVIVPGWPAI